MAVVANLYDWISKSYPPLGILLVTDGVLDGNSGQTTRNANEKDRVNPEKGTDKYGPTRGREPGKDCLCQSSDLWKFGIRHRVIHALISDYEGGAE